MLDLHHDNDSTLLLRQRSLRRAPNIQHSPQLIPHTPTSSSPPPLLTPTHTPPPRKKPTFALPTTMTDALRRFQAFRHARSSSSSSSSSSGTKTPVTPYHKRKHPHVRSHSTPITPESQSQTPQIQTSASAPVVTQPTRALGPSSNSSDPQQAKNGAGIEVPVPPLLREGTQMTKITNKKRKKVMVRLDPDMGQIIWEVMQPGVVGRQRIIPIENIKEMRSASDARYYREQFQLSQVYQDCWLTIIYILDGSYKTLHLIAPSVDVFRVWDATLRKVYAIRLELMSGLGNFEMRQALWEKQYWKGSELEENERLRFGEVEKLCRKMNIHSSVESLFRLFTQADVKNHGYLDFDDFRRFVKLLKGRPEIDRLYKKLIRLKNEEEGVFDFKTFEYFMREVQKSRLSHVELRELFDKHASYNEGEDNAEVHQERATTLSLSAFTSFLMSADNAAFVDQHNKVWHDMTRPLSDYFIASSHNTYLVGHQLVGVSTVEGYIRALLHSCRSVEVDIYDGDVEPMVFHGKSFTSKVSLREVCHAIIKYGFVVSPWPIIISAEMHCSVPQQDMIAEILIEVFGSALVRVGPEGRTKVTELPSPEELKGRILFKTKDVTALRQESSDGTDVFLETSGTSSASDSDALQEVAVDIGMGRKGSGSGAAAGSSSPMISPKITFSPPIQAARTVIQRVRHVGRSPSSTSDSGLGSSPGNSFLRQLSRSETNFPDILSPGLSPKPSSFPPPSPLRTPTPSTKSLTAKPKISPNLQSLLVYTIGVKFQGINKKVDYSPEHMFSLSETTANKIIRPRTDGSSGMYDLIKHCRKHLVRIYPKGLRVSSSNYEPHRYWSAGAQLVAINWQTFDLGYMINHAMFQRNGRSGYVLKPAALRSGGEGKKALLLGRRTRYWLDLTVISGQQLPRLKDSSGREMVDRPVLHPYVEVTVHVPDWTEEMEAGATTMARSVTYRTSAVKNNGFNPVWEEQIRIPFECVGDMWDLVFVRFVVRQEDGKDDEDPLAVYCVSLGSLGQGYRHLPLHDAQLSQYLFSTLFVKVQVLDDS
ncbi:phosphoinositide-specific phospholipase C [Amanita rubescens]|nr:phosphoinositide-specific phospholipase C [Amanita rubescens]